MQTITQPTRAKRINLHKLAEELVANSYTQHLSVEGQDALSRISAACQYIQSDTNVLYQEILKADSKVNWGVLVAAMIEKGMLTSRKEVIAFTSLLKAHRTKALKDWKALDTLIHVTAQQIDITEERLNGIINVVEIYNEDLPATDVNPSVLSVVQLWCKDMPTDKQRSFARLLTKTFEAQQLLQLAK